MASLDTDYLSAPAPIGLRSAATTEPQWICRLAVMDEPRRWISPGRALLVVAAVVLAWSAAVGVLVLGAYQRASEGNGQLQDVMASADGELDDVDLEPVERELAAAHDNFDAAAGYLGHPVVAPAKWLPVLGRQIRSAGALSGAARDVTGHLDAAVVTARELAEEDDAANRTALMVDLSAQLLASSDSVTQADLGPTEGLVGPLRRARVEAAEQFETMGPLLGRYGRLVRALADVTSDGRYLLLGANNAEMRMGVGMALSVGVVEFHDGSFDVTDFESSDELFPIPATPVFDPWMEANWGFLSPTNDFRKLAYSARFDEWIGPAALDMWESETGDRLDGVISMDPFVMGALVDAVGGVELLDGTSFDGEQTIDYLLVEQYREFDAPDGDDGASDRTDARRDRLAEITAAMAVTAANSSIDPVALARDLVPAVAARNLMLYSAEPETQAAWLELGAAGHLTSADVGVHMLNLGASKLDPYLDLSVTATTTVHGDLTTVELHIEVVNSAPAEGLADYQYGPWETINLVESGTYLGRLALIAPGLGDEPVWTGGRSSFVSGGDGPVWVDVTTVRIAPGQTATAEARFSIPSDTRQLRLLPSARPSPVEWLWDGRAFNDESAHEITVHGP